MDLTEAQRDIARAYVNGAPGVLVSGVVWLAAAIVGSSQGRLLAFAVLFFGGMLIVPLSGLIARTVFKAGKAAAGNPLERLGFESTVMLFAGILMAWVLLEVRPQLAFPAIALAIGARYFTFRTIYDETVYWLLGAVLMAIGTVAMIAPFPLPLGTLWLVGIAECVFAAVLLMRWKSRSGAYPG